MLGYIIKKVIGSKNDREVKRLSRAIVPRINEIEQSLQSLPDEALREKTAAWKTRLGRHRGQGGARSRVGRDPARGLRGGEERLPAACWAQDITVRGHVLKWDMVPFDVQLIGGWALHKGRIAEMATGEGKTLVATMPVYLNALTGRGVHLVTVNDYLAARDSEWMGAVYRFLGPDGRLHPPRPDRPRCAASSTTATSPTAPTPSSASITCATTAFTSPRRNRSSADTTTPSWTRWTRS